MIDDARRGCSDLACLKATGIRLAIDDFGQSRVAIRDLRHDLLDGLKLTADLYRDLETMSERRPLSKPSSISAIISASM